MLPAGADAVEPPVAAIGGRGEGGQAVWVGDGGGGGQAVSYTHLTLPTIYSV